MSALAIALVVIVICLAILVIAIRFLARDDREANPPMHEAEVARKLRAWSRKP